MDFLSQHLMMVLIAFFISFLAFLLLLNIFSLPANWIIIGIIFLWHKSVPMSNMDTWFWVTIITLAVIGELLEFGMQIIKAKKYGSSSSGTFAGVIGAFIGAIVLAPLFFGLGALIGAVIGAWLGCFIMEKAKGRETNEALHAAFGAMMGRLLGTILKCGVGSAIVAVTAHKIWPRKEAIPIIDDTTETVLNLIQYIS